MGCLVRALRYRAVVASACISMLGGGTSAQEAPADDRTRLNALSTLPIADVAAFRDKPLFTPSRRAPDVAAEGAEPPLAGLAPSVIEEPPAIRLIGVVQAAAMFVAVL